MGTRHEPAEGPDPRGLLVRGGALAVLVLLLLAPEEGLLLGAWLRAAAREPPSRDYSRVVWIAGPDSGEVDPGEAARIAPAGARLQVWVQARGPVPGPGVLVLGSEAPPGHGSLVRGVDAFEGTLVPAALARLEPSRSLPARGWPWRWVWLDPRQAPGELGLAQVGGAPRALEGRIVVVGAADRLNGPPSPRGVLAHAEAVAWGIWAAATDTWLRRPARGLEFLLAILLALPGILGAARGDGRAGRWAAGGALGGLMAFPAALAAGILVEPACLGLAPLLGYALTPELVRAMAERARRAALVAALAGKGHPERLEAVLGLVPPELGAARRGLYAYLLGGGARPEALAELCADELVALAGAMKDAEPPAAVLEVLEWAFLKEPERAGLAGEIEAAREELAGSLALMDLEGLKAGLDPRYRDLELIGQGAMGLILKGRDGLLERPVAIKLINPAILGDGDGVARFFREVEALAELVHPHVVQIYASHPGRIPYYVMEFLAGETLRKAMGRGGLDEDGKRAVLGQFAEALDYIHGRGVLHRDLKPDNLLLVPRDGGGQPPEVWGPAELRLVVIDFGIARGAGSRALTRVGDVLGTLAYMAPEQVRGGAVDLAADRFAFGVIACELLTGKPPFRGPGDLRSGTRPASLGVARPDLPRPLVEALDALLEPDPARRPGDLGRVRDCLVGGDGAFF